MSGDLQVTAWVDEADLVDAGWHDGEGCRAQVFQEAVAALHEQAHPREVGGPQRCTQEPCRSLYDAAEPRRLGRGPLPDLRAL